MTDSSRIDSRFIVLCTAALAVMLSIIANAIYEHDVVDPLLKQARTSMIAEDWDAVIAASSTAIARDPFRAAAFVYRGRAYEQLDDLDAAERDLTHALRLNSDSAAAQNAMGLLLYRQGYLVEAIKHYNTAIRLDPSPPEYYYNLALALDDYGYPTGAALNYALFLERYPQHDEFARHARTRLAALGG